MDFMVVVSFSQSGKECVAGSIDIHRLMKTDSIMC